MNARTIINLIFIIILIILVCFPPYYGVDNESKGSAHTFLGYKPIWKKISQYEVYSALIDSGRLDSTVEFKKDTSSNQFPYRFQAHFNTIRFIANLILYLVFYISYHCICRALDKRRPLPRI